MFTCELPKTWPWYQAFWVHRGSEWALAGHILRSHLLLVSSCCSLCPAVYSSPSTWSTYDNGRRMAGLARARPWLQARRHHIHELVRLVSPQPSPSSPLAMSAYHGVGRPWSQTEADPRVGCPGCSLSGAWFMSLSFLWKIYVFKLIVLSLKLLLVSSFCLKSSLFSSPFILILDPSLS